MRGQIKGVISAKYYVLHKSIMSQSPVFFSLSLLFLVGETC